MPFLGIDEYTNIGPGGSDPIGGGGEATIYLILHNKYGYIRALRVYKEPVPVSDNSKWESFEKRCSQLMRLGNGNHPSIVHIYKLSRLEDRRPYIEVDYIKGETLRSYLQNNKNCLPIEEVLHMVEQISSALAYCHYDTYKFSMNPDTDSEILKPDPMDGSKLQPLSEDDIKELVRKHRVIHNDIHSGNIMRRNNGDFVLIDFGLSVEGYEDIGSQSTRRRDGHPEFKAPERWNVEQKEQSKPTPQSDIYSFGVVMYEYLTGRPPFPSRIKEGLSPQKDDNQLMDAHQNKEVPPIFGWRKLFYEKKHKEKYEHEDYPKWLEEAIFKCLKKNPDERFKDGKELHQFVVEHMKADKASQDLESLRSKIQELNEELDALKKDKTDLEKQLTVAKTKIADLEEKIKNPIIGSGGSVKTELEKKLEEANKKIILLERSLRGSKKRAWVIGAICGIGLLLGGVYTWRSSQSNNEKFSNLEKGIAAKDTLLTLKDDLLKQKDDSINMLSNELGVAIFLRAHPELIGRKLIGTVTKKGGGNILLMEQVDSVCVLKAYALKGNKYAGVEVFNIGTRRDSVLYSVNYNCWSSSNPDGSYFVLNKDDNTLYVPMLKEGKGEKIFGSDRYIVYGFDGNKFVHKGYDGGFWLHPDLRNYKALVAIFKSKNYLIRIDEITKGYRYAVWKRNDDMASSPEMVLEGGLVGTGRFLFENGSYGYHIDMDSGTTLLTVTRANDTLRQEFMETVVMRDASCWEINNQEQTNEN